MKKQSVIIYSVFAVAIYLFSIILFCSSLYSEYQDGKLKTEESFNFITNKMMQNTSYDNFETEASKLLNKFVHSSDRIAEVTLKMNDSYIFFYPETSIQDSRYINNFSYTISYENRTITLQAKGYLIRPSKIFEYGKSSFLIILVVTVITLILIVIVSNQGQAKTAEDSDEETEENNNDEADSEDNQDVNNEEKSKDEYDVSFNETLTELLRNSIANEKEFAIFVMKFLGIEKTSEEYRKLIELLEDRMKAQNLVFEGKDDTLILLKNDTNIDENLTIAENTINEIEQTYADFKPVCYVGISNRNQRIVTGERLLFEAEAALEHAEETEEKVIAFRANTEQYNEFMNQN
ncbi:hypothetical protein [Treponema sp. C6A8]|uniref:hypothetical protein n=1 Tax=Treponema sp. C6A8 TaxID=1410609 RepID=UPI000483993A|nr:hypothetical protein [Treponema sp. C6A8]